MNVETINTLNAEINNVAELNTTDCRNTVAFEDGVDGKLPVYGFRIAVFFDAVNKKGEKVRRRTVKTVWSETPEQAMTWFEREYAEFVGSLGNPYIMLGVPLRPAKQAVATNLLPAAAEQPVADEAVAA